MEYLNIKELQDTLGISRQTIYRWIAKGLPVIKVGGLVRFDAVDIKKWMDDNREVKK